MLLMNIELINWQMQLFLIIDIFGHLKPICRYPNSSTFLVVVLLIAYVVVLLTR